MKQALRRAGEDDPAWMKFHLTSGLKDLSIRKALLLRSYTSLDDLCDDVLMEARYLKEVEATSAQAHLTPTTPQDGEQDDDSTKVESEDQDFSYDGGYVDMTDHGMFPSVVEASEDVFYDALTEVEHGIFPSTKAMIGVEFGDACTYVPPTPIYEDIHHIPCESETHPPHLNESENMSELCATTTNESECISFERMIVTTTSPIYDEMPQLPCEESHHHHLSDPTKCDFECTHLEGVSEPPQMMSEEVVRSCEANLFSND